MIRKLDTVVLILITGVYKCAPVNEVITTHFWQILDINLKISFHINFIVHILKTPSYFLIYKLNLDILFKVTLFWR